MLSFPSREDRNRHGAVRRSNRETIDARAPFVTRRLHADRAVFGVNMTATVGIRFLKVAESTGRLLDSARAGTFCSSLRSAVCA